MTGAAPARRLLARLVDEQAIETEPIAEVRADLAALGIDPTRTIALSRRLAANARTPATALLRRIAESEEDDDETRRLERADIGAIRESLPDGVAAAATAAHARRSAGTDSNIISLRRRRSRRLLYGLGGVAAAMAASLVFYVGLSTEQPFRLQTADEAPQLPASPPVALPAERKGESRLNQAASPPSSAAEADAPKTESSGLAQQQVSGIQAANEPAASGARSIARPPTGGVSTTPAANEDYREVPPLRRDEQALADAAEVQARRGELAEELEKSAAVGPSRAEPSEQPQQPADIASAPAAAPLPGPSVAIIPPPKPDLDASPDLAQTADSMGMKRMRESVQSVATDAAAPTSPPAAPFGLAHPVIALLIVDPGLAPPGLRQEDYPIGALPARLSEARRLAEGRAVVALVTLRVHDRIVDAIISESRKGKGLSVAEAVPDADSAALGRVDPGYALIELDRR